MKKLSVIFVLLFSIFFFSSQTDAASSSQLLIINKKINTLAYYDGGKLVKTFKVATGKSRDLTPEGNFRIVNKIVNRPYYKNNIPGGDPSNPLGNRWMGLEVRGTYGTTYGIHGNNNESSIGKYVSSGCVRMHNGEVRWLFDKIQLNTMVIITYSDSSFDAIAKANGYSVSTNGWVQIDTKWYFYVNGVAKKGWLSQSGTWYFFDGSGVMKTGWLANGGSWYYLQPNGAMKTGWLSNGGKWYYLDKSGVMKTGWLSSGGKWFYLDSGGTMKTGWVSVKGTWYYFENSGIMKTGWLDSSGGRYFLNSSGAMEKGWKKIANKWYYFNASGKMASNTVIDGFNLGNDGAWIQVEYVALGDSLAYGQTPLGGKDLGYPDYIKKDFEKSYQVIDYDNFGVSGYTSVNLLDRIKTDGTVRKEIKEATHITIDIGANDLLPVIQKDPAQAPAAIAAVSANLNTILSTIDQLNPKVKVYVMGYYNPFPYLPQEQQDQLLPLLIAFNGQIQSQAVQHGDTFVQTDTVIANNFKEYLPIPQNIHLSLSGYQVLAGEFWKVMK